MSSKPQLTFTHENGRIFLTVEILVWGEWVEMSKDDVTDKVLPVVDDYLDHNLGLTDYKHTNGRLRYTGEDKFEK